jgi:HPt (histidine-containing phosphotransfer) domain-containing protein
MIVDLEKLMTHYRMDKNTMLKMLDLYIKSSSEDFIVLTEAMNKKDIGSVKKIVHKLKSAYSYLLIKKVALLCDMIKKEADSSMSYSQLVPILNEFCETHLFVLNQVKQLRKKQYA